MSQAYLKIYCTTLAGDQHTGTPRQIGNSTPWTRLEMEMEVPEGTYQVWAWLCYNAPSDGRVYFDDASLEIVTPGRGASKPAGTSPPAKSPGKRTGATSGPR